MKNNMSPKEEEARNSLPKELRQEFDKLVADYKYVATLKYGRPYVSYIVLADLIKSGWRNVADPIEKD